VFNQHKVYQTDQLRIENLEIDTQHSHLIYNKPAMAMEWEKDGVCNKQCWVT
jgi:hypothetical protein